MPEGELSPVSILIVDDRPENLSALRAILGEQPGYELVEASSSGGGISSIYIACRIGRTTSMSATRLSRMARGMLSFIVRPICFDCYRPGYREFKSASGYRQRRHSEKES